MKRDHLAGVTPGHLEDMRFDGMRSLSFVLEGSVFGSVFQAVASLALFTNPERVRETRGSPLFRLRRRGEKEARGCMVDGLGGRPVMCDDNSGPIYAFLWANRLSRNDLRNVHYCHIWKRSADVDAYTNLANLVAIPDFLAKLSDTDLRIGALLRKRAWDLYQWRPEGCQIPGSPGVEVQWADPLPVAYNDCLENELRRRMQAAPGNRASRSARDIGWLFSNWQPDALVPAVSRTAVKRR